MRADKLVGQEVDHSSPLSLRATVAEPLSSQPPSVAL
jgi:hypothetical protein